MVRRLFAGLLTALVFAVATAPLTPVRAQSNTKDLSPVRGTVGYQAAADGSFQRVVGHTALPDDAYAVTQVASIAALVFPDSSRVEIGERTTVKVGAFDAAAPQGSVLTVNRGAMHFKIQHPQGGKANYTFKTATSQIAVRGTEAFLIVGEHGTQLICIDCAPGDVFVTIGGKTIPLTSGHTITITGTSPADATSTIADNALNNPALTQFALLVPGFAVPAGVTALDPTGYVLGGIAHTGAAIIPIALGGAVVGAVIASNNHTAVPTPTPTPVPSPTPTATPTAAPTASPTATPTAIPTAAPTVTPTATPTARPTATPTATPTASPTVTSTPTPSPTPIPYGTLVVQPALLQFDGVPTQQHFTVQQSGPGGVITMGQPNCFGNGAAASVSPSSFPITINPPPANITVTAQAAPTVSPPPAHSCQLTVTGGNGQTATVYLHIRSTQIGITGRRAAPGSASSPSQGSIPAPIPTPTAARPQPSLAPPTGPARPPHR